MLPRAIPELTEEQWEQVEEMARKQKPEALEKARAEAVKFLKTLKHEYKV